MSGVHLLGGTKDALLDTQHITVCSILYVCLLCT